MRCIQRVGRRGLSTACIEGVLASAAPYFAIMDADLQHDEAVLPHMLEALRTGAYDIAIGSRYLAGGDLGGLSGRSVGISKFGTQLSRVICKADIADPMSGFFVVRREVFENAIRRLSGRVSRYCSIFSPLQTTHCASRSWVIVFGRGAMARAS